MTFLPDGRLLVTEKKGALKLLNLESKLVGDISGVPEVAYGGQGGFGDVILHPQFAQNSIVYVSYSEPGDRDTSGAAVARAKLALDNERRRQARRFHSDLAPGAQGGQPRSLGPSPRLRTRRQVVDHLERAPAVHAGAGHEEQSRQGRAAQRRRLGAGGQSLLRAGRRHRADLVAGPSQPVRHRVRAGRQAVHARDGPAGRRRAQRHRERRELRLSDRLERRSLRRPRHSRSPDAARVQGAARHLESGHLAGRLHHLHGQDVPGLERRWLHRRPVVRVAGARGVRQRRCARSAALRHGQAHPRSRARTGRRHLVARRPSAT